LVLAIAVDALGKDKVRAVMMPSPYTADISWIDARDMANRLGVRYDEISIKHTFESFKGALAEEFKGRPEDTAEENIQARIRGTLLMGLSNKFGSIVLTTGNKSEMATGYCTLYGDMAGGFAVIKDLLKTTVFALARWRNATTRTAPAPSRFPSASSRGPPAPSCGPTRPTRTACRPTTSSTASWHATCRTTKASTRSLPRATTARWSSGLRGSSGSTNTSGARRR
jgi:NAD+ synthase (glutamine-hydrolysing)